MKNSNDTIANRTHDLPACSEVPQPNAQRLRSAYTNAIFSLLLVKMGRHGVQAINMRQQRNRLVFTNCFVI